MLRDSLWYPNGPKQAILVAIVLVMIPLHQTEFIGLMDSTTLVFGWLPMQLAYDAAYTIVAALVAYAIYRIAPKPPEEFEPASGGGE